jgi:hypothetical protein
MDRLRVAGLAAILALFLAAAAACSSTAADDDGRRPTPDNAGPQITEPPAADLEDASGNLTRGAPGTRCWGGLCIDFLSPVTQADPATVRRGETLDVVFEAGPPAEVVHSWHQATSPAPAPGNNGVRSWGAMMPITSETGTIAAPGEPGTYVLIVFARWDAPVRGDVTYGFYIEVR